MKSFFKLLFKTLSMLAGLVGIVFIWVVVNRARLSYNEEGVYFDPVESVTYHEQAITFYAIVAFGFVVSSLLFMLLARKFKST